LSQMLYFAGFRQTQPGLPNHRMSTRIRSPHVILKSPQLRFKLEKTAVLRGSRSDRPCYHAHTRWTLQAATSHGRVMLHTRPCALARSWQRHTGNLLLRLSINSHVALDTRVAHSFLHWPLTLTYDLHLLSPSELWLWLMHKQNQD